ncbi:uncharacterized protein [Argopecten irradians]|uniref:uncharacterized protein n=1 Tax=Argopecten irradians TaxID=31199 RepID=UPI0037121BD2
MAVTVKRVNDSFSLTLCEHLKQLLALPFLPSAQIEPAFRNLSARANTPELRDLVSYIDSQWIRSRVWSPTNWCVYRQPVRTNNDVEGWHHRLNGKAGRANLPFYMLVPLLLKEATLVTIQQRLVSKNALQRHQRVAFRRIQGRVHTMWDQYDHDELTTSQFLKEDWRCLRPSSCGPGVDCGTYVQLPETPSHLLDYI